MSEATLFRLHHGELRFTAHCYEAHGEARGTVLALHGFPDSPSTFRPLIPALQQAGYRVVTPVLRGYEQSSIPSVPDYRLATLATDVAAWLEQEPLAGQRVHLLGHDWGAACGYAAAARLGSRIASFTALAIPPVGGLPWAMAMVPGQFLRFWYQYLAIIPGLGESRYAADNFALVEKLWRRWSPGLEPPRELLEEVRARFRQPPVLTAALRYYRALYPFYWFMEPLFRRPVLAPTLILNGVRDGCMDARLFPFCVEKVPFEGGVRHLPLSDCGHWLHLERTDAVLENLVAHLETCSAP